MASSTRRKSSHHSHHSRSSRRSSTSTHQNKTEIRINVYDLLPVRQSSSTHYLPTLFPLSLHNCRTKLKPTHPPARQTLHHPLAPRLSPPPHRPRHHLPKPRIRLRRPRPPFPHRRLLHPSRHRRCNPRHLPPLLPLRFLVPVPQGAGERGEGNK